MVMHTFSKLNIIDSDFAYFLIDIDFITPNVLGPVGCKVGLFATGFHILLSFFCFSLYLSMLWPQGSQ